MDDETPLLFPLPEPSPEPSAAGPSWPDLDEPMVRELFELGVAARALEPWQKLEEDDWFGIEDPDDGSIVVVMTMGSGEMFSAVQVYRPPEGIRFVNAIEQTGEVDEDIARFQIRMVECEFVNKAELPPWDEQRYKRFDLKAGRKRKSWPAFGQREPLKAPWAPDPEGAELLALALRLLPRFIEAFPSLPQEVYEACDAEGTLLIPLYRLRPGGDRRTPGDWQLTSGPLPKAPPMAIEPDEVFDARMAKLEPRKGTRWQVGSIALPEPVLDESGIPVFARAALAIDERDPEVPKPDFEMPGISDDALLRRCFGRLAEEKGYLPEQLIALGELTASLFKNCPAMRGVEVVSPEEVSDNMVFLEGLFSDLTGAMDGGESAAPDFEAALDSLENCDPDDAAQMLEMLRSLGGSSSIVSALEQALEGKAGATLPGAKPVGGLGSKGTANRAVDLYRPPQSRKRYQLRIDLMHTKPPIWRRITIPTDASFFDLHVAIQEAMGWQDSHLHAFEFRRGGALTHTVEWPRETPDFGPPIERLHELTTPLESLLRGGRSKFHYIYDWGDHWEHQIKVEAVIDHPKAGGLPELLKGKGACPPEDCGGIDGYYRLLEAPVEDIEWMEPEELESLRSATFEPDTVRFSEVRDLLD